VIRAVIFDIDGVLVQSGRFGQHLQSLGIDATSLQSFWHGPFAECSLGRADLKQALSPFVERWGYPGTVDDCLNAWFEADSTLNHPLLEEIEQLRAQGLPCHVASTQERHRARYLERVMGLGRRFDRFFFSCHLGVKKPHAEFYRRITTELGAPPSSLLYFDDQQANVDAARAAGWNAELYTIGDALLPAARRHGLLPR
jgi:putative hydrolase of the HAD superfamily